MMVMVRLFRGGAPSAHLCVQFHAFIPTHHLWPGATIRLTTAPLSLCVCVCACVRVCVCVCVCVRARAGVAVCLHDVTMARVEALSWLQQRRSPTLTSSRVQTDR